MMNIKQLKEQIKLRYTTNVYANLTNKERKLYRLGFKTGYKLAREYFKTNTIVKQNTVIKEVIKYVTINDVVVPFNVKHALTIIANQLSIDVNEILTKTRIQPAVIARSILINVLRDKYDMPFTKIGVLLGNRDHTTMIHHVRMKMNKKHFWQPNHIIWNRYKYVMDNVK
jgi:chromosomal replication initiation ATPase DnaA